MTHKILILRRDPQARRLLALTLADAGYDIRPFGVPAEALQCAQEQLFDLVLVDQQQADTTGLDWIEDLRMVQPTVPVFLVAEKLDVAAVVKGIRLGVADVLSPADAPAAILQRTDLLLRPGSAAAVAAGVTGDERLSAALQAVLAHPERQNDEQLLQKEREALAADWAAIHEEQLRLRKERHRLRNEAMIHQGELERFERACAEFERKQADARARQELTRHEALRVEDERRQLDAAAAALREQEANLRAYEERLRELQAQHETNQVERQAGRGAVAQGASDLEIRAAWEKIQRATNALAAERKNMIDERLAIKDQTAAVQRREAELEQREAQVAARERQFAQPAPVVPKEKAPFIGGAPLLAAKSLFSLGRS
jgi:DNA-binding response OmpR family regulator